MFFKCKGRNNENYKLFQYIFNLACNLRKGKSKFRGHEKTNVNNLPVFTDKYISNYTFLGVKKSQNGAKSKKYCFLLKS